jgi:uncharacterized protein YciI
MEAQMRKLNILLTIVVVIGIIFGVTLVAVCGTSQNGGKANPPAKKQSFLVIYRPGPAWLTGKPVTEQPLKEHGKYMLDLYKSKVMRMAGPFEDNTGGAVVLDVSGEDEAKSVVAHDPAVISRVFTYELHPWRLVSWEQYLK